MSEWFTVDIDTGGTFTDGFFTRGSEYKTVKVDTTPHDLTICFNNCIAEGARRFGFDQVEDFLVRTKTIRLSTTIGTNSIIQRTGPKIGLLVSAGHEQDLYQEQNPILHFLVDPDLVVGLSESVDGQGTMIEPVRPEDVRLQTKRLLEAGARVFVVSLSNAHLNPANEVRVRQIIQEDFPTHYLGSKPILLGSEVSLRTDDGIRTNAAIVNAYLHRDMVKYLYKADEEIRQRGFTRPLLVAHANGGVARVAKTKAIDTYNSGPAAGLLGSLNVGKQYGLDNILTVDVGGTSTDVGLIYNERLLFDSASSIAGIPVHVPLIHVLSVGGGGGSIAKVNHQGQLQVGPESAGAVPGPACFDLGGSRPTVTDAVIALGWINPDFFLGGRKHLNTRKAIDVITRDLADPLGVSVIEAASRVVDELASIGAQAMRRLTSERGHAPERFALFSFGGAGGLFSAEMARKCGIKTVYTFPFSSVFSAFGLSTADITHVYERRIDFPVKPESGAGDASVLTALQRLIERMRQTAFVDMRGEGFRAEEVQFEVELEGVVPATGTRRTVSLPPALLLSERTEEQMNDVLAESCGVGSGQPWLVEIVRLRARVAVPHYTLPVLPLAGADASGAKKGTRRVFWAADEFE
ncbi:MAG: hydantoinase/oxoprolinase family protein, partial [Alicyclobacillus shizuokensis]|nr:hydantoinase/oxoprolinase family protein [Alicyclobacillus shizuokensis]